MCCIAGIIYAICMIVTLGGFILFLIGSIFYNMHLSDKEEKERLKAIRKCKNDPLLLDMVLFD